MDRIFIKNGKVITPDSVEKKNLLLENGKIADDNYIGKIPDNTKIIDADGCYVSPGFIEIHAHGAGGFDFADATNEAFSVACDTHLKHGTTSILPTAVSMSPESMDAFFEEYRKYAASDHNMNLLGIHLEGPFISQAMKGAQNPSYVRNPSEYEVDKLVCEAGDIIKYCTAAPELDGIEYMADKMLKSGIVLSAGHSDATYEQTEKGYEMGFHHITHLYSNTPTVRKINQVVCAGIREAAYLIDGMTIELIGDGHHVPKEVLRLALKVKGADKINLTSDAMRAAGTDVKESYLGEIKPENRVIIEDGVAKLPDRSFYAGSITTGDKMLRWAVNDCKVPIYDAVRMLSLTPAEIIHEDAKKGSIEKGKDADILLIDKNLGIEKIIQSGKILDI